MKKTFCFLLVVVLVVCLAVPALGNNSRPNGPWVEPGEETDLNRFATVDDVQKTLYQIQAKSKGRLEVEVVGYSSVNSYPIHVAKFGAADPEKTRVFIQTQIHGNEPAGTEAALQLIQQLATGNSPEIRLILDKLSIWIIPMLNPEGAMYARPSDGMRRQLRQNRQAWTPAEWGLPSTARQPWYRGTSGYDINRDFHANLDFVLSPATSHLLPGTSSRFGFFVTPEGRASRDVFKALQPNFFIDHHHRGHNIVSADDNTLCTLQIIAQVVNTEGVTVDGVYYPLPEEGLTLSKQVNSYVYQKLNEKGNSHYGGITKYPTVNLPGTALGSYSLNNSGIMLYETRGQSSTLGPKSAGMLIRQSYIGFYETLLGLATGEVYDVDPSFYDNVVPPAGPTIRRPYAAEAFEGDEAGEWDTQWLFEGDE